MNKIESKHYLFKTEKRSQVRVDFDLDIFYPHINNESGDYSHIDGPVLQAINVSVEGICFISKIPLCKSDFISFLMKIDENPSFSCLVQVKWIGITDDAFRVGCEFVSLSLHQINMLKEYVSVKKL